MKYIKRWTICGIVFLCLLGGVFAFWGPIGASDVYAREDDQAIPEIKNMEQKISCVDWDARIYQLDQSIESGNRKVAQIRVYAGEAFRFVDSAGTLLEEGDRVDVGGRRMAADTRELTGTVCLSEDGWYVLWEDPELGAWDPHTLYIQADESFAGGNNVTVGVSGRSGVYLQKDAEQADAAFDTTKVNVRLGIVCENKQLNVMAGQPLSDKELADYAALYPSSMWGRISDIPLAGQWYEVKDGAESAVGPELRGISYSLPSDLLSAMTEDSLYRLKLYYVGSPSDSQARENSGGREVLCSSASPLASADFTMRHITGQIDLTVWLKQFPYKEETSIFAFELYKADGYDQPVTEEDRVGTYEVAFGSGEEKLSESLMITGLDAGWYTLVPLAPEGDYVGLLERRRDNQYPVAKTGSGAGISFHIGEILPSENDFGNVTYLGEDATPVTVDYYYKETYYPVRYTANNPDGTILSGTCPEDTARYKKGDMVTVKGSDDMAVEGYVFAGWALEPGDGIYKEGETLYGSGSARDVQLSGQIAMPEDGLELYGRWIKVYKVEYDGNTATGGSAPVQEGGSAGGNTFYSGDPVTVRGQGDLTKTDADGTTYGFVGWNDRQDGQGQMYLPGDVFSMGEADVTLYAQWLPENADTYGVTYMVNHPEDVTVSGEPPSDTHKYETGEAVEVSGAGTLSMRHYLFAGWALTSSEDGLYDPGETLYGSGQDERTGVKTLAKARMPENGLTLYSRWIPLYSLSYLAGADGVEGVPEQEEYLEKEMVQVDDGSGLHREGYIFMGWNTRPDGSGQTYDSGLTFNMPAEDMVLYAQWERVPIPETEEGTDDTPKPPDDRGFIVTVICLAGVAMVALYILWQWVRQKIKESKHKGGSDDGGR